MLKGKYKIALMGRFRFLDPDGREIFLRFSKMQALIALLATDPNMLRTRGWLQDKLWSDRESSKGANSLRQILHQFRRCLNQEDQIIQSNRVNIWLNPKKVQLSDEEGGEFLEGLDVKDQEFERWLLSERLNRGGAPSTRSVYASAPVEKIRGNDHGHHGRGLSIECANDIFSTLGQFEAHLGDVIRKSIREVMDFEPVDPKQLQDGTTTANILRLSIQTRHALHGQIIVRLAVLGGAGSSEIWADSRTFDLPNNPLMLPTEILNFSCRVVSVVSSELSMSGDVSQNDANYFANVGVQRMFSMLPGSIEEAGVFFRRANDISSRGLFFGLLAQLAVIDFVESGGENRETLREMADEYSSKALCLEGTNSVVLSSVAHARLVFEQDFEAAGELAKLGVTANPANPMAWSTWANILLNKEKYIEAAKAARMALQLSKDTPFRYWTEFQYATTAVALHKNVDAIRHAERARALNPKYKPALRYLVGLYADAREAAKSQAAYQRLKRLEPDLSVDRFVNDKGYPISMMRSAGLVAGRLKSNISD